jgi:hypothetical protein
MNIRRTRLSRPALALLILGAAFGSTSALAAQKSRASEAQARYQQERAVCMSGKSNQDRTTCLREAGAAFAQAKREGWADGSAQQAANERKRCEGLPADDRQACIARMQGQGTTSGSAAAGGIYRELVTREVGTPIIVVPDNTAPVAPTK